jgi:hypothetical protein
MSKKQDILEKYSKLNSRKIGGFEKLVEGDFTLTTKYATYMCGLWLWKGTYQTYTVKQIINAVKDFDTLLPYIENKDIYSADYNTFDKLIEKVSLAAEIKADKEFIRENHIKVLVDNDGYLLGRLLTLEGAMKYGKGTKWCISAKNNSQFKSYNGWNYIYVLIRKKTINKSCDKYAILIEKANAITSAAGWWNSFDNNVSSSNIMNSSWDIITVIEVTNIIRADAIAQQRIEKAKSNIESYQKMLNSVANIDLSYDLSLLKNIGDDRFEDLNKTVKDIANLLKENNNL